MASAPTLSTTPHAAAAPAAKPADPPNDVLADLGAARLWASHRPSRAHAYALPRAGAPAGAGPTSIAPPVPSPTAARKPSPRRTRPASKPALIKVALTAPDSERTAAVVAYARAQVGKPYRFATAGPDSFDCSGLAKAAYSTIGVTIPHQTGGIVKLGRQVPRAELEPGDLVFPSSGHVGIYIGGGKMVHAPKPGDHVRIADIYAFWTARRLL